MKRAFDLCLTGFALVAGVIPLTLIALVVKLTSRGPVLYWSDRIGRDNRIFRMPKFRTMRVDTPEVASHLLDDPDRWLTPIGNLLRRTSLDEFPQLWNIVRGDMSLVGPRPALHNQHDLIALRTFHGVHRLLPGLTGWAQINGRDETSIAEKVALDTHYLHNRSFRFDIEILVRTFLQVILRKGTSVPDGLRGVAEQAVPAEAFLSSAAVWFEQGALEKALADCDRAIRLDPGNAVAHNSRSTFLAAQSEHAAGH
ncbi:MAG: sugar transferase [Pirellulales bacterium]|nr:sugar transferase [Pirellulales bacterium]